MNRNEKAQKPVHPGNSIMVRPDGPLICNGNITLQDADGKLLLKGKEIALCRCGLSKKKPFCDGTHKVQGVQADQNFDDTQDEQIDEIKGGLVIRVKKNAMYSIQGKVTIFSRDGNSKTTRSKVALCRCGASMKKPFCDATHKKCGFSD